MNSKNEPSSAPAELSTPAEAFTPPFPESPLASALVVADELSEALARHGVTLPSVSADLASCTGGDAGRALVELGRANLATVARLTAVLAEKADRG